MVLVDLCVAELEYDMACYKPIEAWYSQEINPSGKRSLVFNRNNAIDPDSPITIACGQCIGCRLKRSREWAIRCVHEAQLYKDNCFITLTFSDEGLQKRDVSRYKEGQQNIWTVDVDDFQLFMKKLRKKYGSKIRYFHCGEYGEVCANCGRNKRDCETIGCNDWTATFGRPHYHACLFNFNFPDKKLHRITPTGERLYVSETLQKLWPYGFSTIGEVTFDSSAYVARYIMKKITGDMAEDHYYKILPDGECIQIAREYVSMSRRSAIGKEWFEKYSSDVYPKDFITIAGKKFGPPKYYDKLLEKDDPYLLDEIKEDRIIKMMQYKEDLTPDRLRTREKVQDLKLKKLVRHTEEV
jgi:hypothetical protein